MPLDKERRKRKAYIDVVLLAQVHLPIGAALDFQVSIGVYSRD